MKILYHHRTRGKGAEGAHILGMVEALRSVGHQVVLMSLPGADPEEAKKLAANAADVAVVSRSFFGRLIVSLSNLTRHVPEFVFELFEMAYNVIAIFRLCLTVKKYRPDFIYERYSLFMIAGVLVAKVTKTPIILEVNDAAVVERIRPLYLQRLAQLLEGWAFKRCDGLVFISHNFSNTVEAFYGSVAPSIVSPNGANIEEFSSDDQARAVVRSELGLNGKVVCGYVGAFNYWHGIDWFVEEIIPVIKKRPNLVLLLVGDGALFGQIREQVISNQLQSQIVMTGRVPHNRVRNYVSAMDFGILPDSNLYGSPMKLFEMMAMGVASVCPAFEPIQEVVVDTQTGWLFPVKDRRAAVERVMQISSDPEIISQVGGQAAAYIKRERQWVHNAEILLELVRKI